MRLLLVRHGDAGSKETWAGDDRDRPLSAGGRREAAALADLLQPFDAARIISSPLLRCTQTMEPLARRLHLPLETSDLLTPDNTTAAVEFLREFRPPDPVVVCTHGEVIGYTLTALAETDPIDLGPNPQWPKSSFWVMTQHNGRFLDATYHAPPSTTNP